MCGPLECSKHPRGPDQSSNLSVEVLAMANSKFYPKQAAHRMSRTREYKIRIGILSRCYDPGRHEYPRYGGRGITVCERWRISFEAFYADMGPRPSPQHSVERIDNSGNYEPGNCKWATPLEQQRNTRFNRLITFRGETLCLAEWAGRVGVLPKTLGKRIRKWPLERALTTPKYTNLDHGESRRRRP